jgi:hypothetical protein
VEFTDPSEPSLSDEPGSIRSFTAVVTKPATLEFFVDEESTGDIFENTSSAILPNLSLDNGHTVKIVATAPNETATNSVTWMVASPPYSSDQLISENGCEGTSAPADAVIRMKSALYKRKNGDRYVLVWYICGACQSLYGQLLPGGGSKMTLNIQVWWEPITQPHFSERIIVDDKTAISGEEVFSIPSEAGTITVVATLDTECGTSASTTHTGQTRLIQHLLNDDS